MVFLTAGFARETAEKRLDLKSLKGQTKAEEVGDHVSNLPSLRLPLKALYIEPVCRENSRKTAKPRVHREGTDPLLTYKNSKSRGLAIYSVLD